MQRRSPSQVSPMRTRRVGRSAAGFAALALIALAGCGGGSHSSDQTSSSSTTATTPSGPAPRAGSQGTLTVAWASQPQTLDPTAGNLFPGSLEIQEEMFDTLAEEVPGSSSIVPGLATSWKPSSDALTWTFHLRPAEFSNGDPVTASDVVFTITRDLNPKDAPFVAGLLSFIKSVSAADAHTVVFHLKTPTAVLPQYLVLPPTGVVDAKYYTKVGPSGFNQHPVGSGPFTLVSNTPGRTIVLQRNLHYWRTGYPYASRVVFKYIPNDTTRMVTVESGNADIGIGVPFSQISSLRAAPGVKIQSDETTGQMPVFLSWKNQPALASQAVRQALSYATPSSVINRVAFGGIAQPSNAQMPTIAYNNTAVKPYPYDLAKAKQLMASSPTPSGFPLTLTIVGTDTPSAQTAAVLQQSWGQIGVKVNIQTVDIGTFSTLQSESKYQALMGPVGYFDSDVPIEDEIAQLFPIDNSASWTYYHVPAITALVKKAVSTTDQATRKQLFFQLQQEWMQNPEVVPIVNTPAVSLLRSGVTGFGTTINYYLDLYAARK